MRTPDLFFPPRNEPCGAPSFAAGLTGTVCREMHRERALPASPAPAPGRPSTDEKSMILKRLAPWCAAILLTACTGTPPEKDTMFTPADFAHLRFLEGRWEGIGPDGKPFHERYVFPSDIEMRSVRYTDATFSKASDGSTVTLEGGTVTSRWQQFTWTAVDLAPGKACFEPVAAPSAFCWERVSDAEVRVTQRWSDDQGKPQQYSVALRRL